jgi:DNA-binding transcriptional MerR regulator
MIEQAYSIAAVERDTGLSKDVLRVWERRYGFPVPERDAHGERLYPADQVARLRLIKRLMDQGHRPGKLIAAPLETLDQLPPRRRLSAVEEATDAPVEDFERLLDMIRRHDSTAFQQALAHHLARRGLSGFVHDILAPLSHRVGLAWERGRFEVHEEHFFTELSLRMLRQAIAGLPPRSDGPCILLTTLPEEKHALGLLMAETLLTLDGARCISLGTETPVSDIAKAAGSSAADVVALSFSAAFPSRQIPAALLQLRQQLPAHVRLWAGGAGIAKHPRPGAGIDILPTLADARQALQALISESTVPAG